MSPGNGKKMADRIQFPHVVRSFVVASNNQGQQWRDLGPGVVPEARMP